MADGMNERSDIYIFKISSPTLILAADTGTDQDFSTRSFPPRITMHMHRFFSSSVNPSLDKDESSDHRCSFWGGCKMSSYTDDDLSDDLSFSSAVGSEQGGPQDAPPPSSYQALSMHLHEITTNIDSWISRLDNPDTILSYSRIANELPASSSSGELASQSLTHSRSLSDVASVLRSQYSQRPLSQPTLGTIASS